MKGEKIADLLAEQINGEWGDEGNNIAILRTTNFTNDGHLDFSNVVRRNVSHDKILKKKLKIGDTIIEKSGGSPSQPVGRVVYFDATDQEYLCNNFTSVLRPSKEVDSKYIFWLLFANHIFNRTLKYQNKTTGIINLKLERYLQETQIPLPSLTIQKIIATILDKADSMRKKDKQLLEHYNELAQSIFYEMFGDPMRNEKGWKIMSIKDIVQDVKYGTSKPSEEVGKYPYLRMNNITYFGEWDFSDLKYINLTEEELSKYILKRGDLVFNRTNSKDLVGKTAVYKSDEKMAIAGYLIRVRTNEKAVTDYVSAFLNSSYGKVILKGMCKNIIGMANINAQELQSIQLPVPPAALQLKFKEKIEKIIQQKNIVMQQQEHSESLFQNLLQKAFKGELVKEP